MVFILKIDSIEMRVSQYAMGALSPIAQRVGLPFRVEKNRKH